MNRRGFLGTLLGAGAAAALPSEVWPFRKIFLPLLPNPFTYVRGLRIADGYPGPLSYPHESIDGLYRVEGVQLENIMALELETFRAEIPELLMNESTFYEMLKRKDPVVEFEGHAPTALAANQVLRAVSRDLVRARDNGSLWIKRSTQG